MMNEKKSLVQGITIRADAPNETIRRSKLTLEQELGEQLVEDALFCDRLEISRAAFSVKSSGEETVSITLQIDYCIYKEVAIDDGSKRD